MSKDDGTLAFPNSHTPGDFIDSYGMTLRDAFALATLAGFASNTDMGELSMKAMAHESYRMAGRDDGSAQGEGWRIASTRLAFRLFWKFYPRKIGKSNAWMVWKKKVKPLFELDVIESLRSQIDAGMFGTDKKFIPHARTWLNQKRWEDEIEHPTKALQRDSEVRSRKIDEVRRIWKRSGRG